MKFKYLSLFLVLALSLGMGFVSPVQAVGYGTSFVTSVTYMNVGTDTATITVDFYQEGTSTVAASYPVTALAPNAAASLGVGSVFTNSSFKGSAVMSSNQPLVATMVQVPSGTTTVKNRPMSNGFSSGSTSVLIPTVLRNTFNSNSIFSVQNAGSAAADVSVHFIPINATSGTDKTVTITALAPGAAKYYDMGTFTDAGTTFNGSVRVTSTQPMVASSMELSLNSDAVYAFEGTSGGATTLYMPSAMCNFGPTNATSFYAIQNTSTSTATSVSVHFTGTANGAAVDKVYDLPSALQPGQKVSVGACSAGTPAKFLGAAVVTAQQPVVAIAKIVGAGAYQAAHLGASAGATKLAAPYVRYSDKFFPASSKVPVQQANIAVQNIGGSTIPANSIKVEFFGVSGNATYTYAKDLPSGAKFSVNPKVAGMAEFGYKASATTGLPSAYGGGAIITGPAGSQLAAVIRVETNLSGNVGAYINAAEDYNAIPVQ